MKSKIHIPPANWASYRNKVLKTLKDLRNNKISFKSALFEGVFDKSAKIPEDVVGFFENRISEIDAIPKEYGKLIAFLEKKPSLKQLKDYMNS